MKQSWGVVPKDPNRDISSFPFRSSEVLESRTVGDRVNPNNEPQRAAGLKEMLHSGIFKEGARAAFACKRKHP